MAFSLPRAADLRHPLLERDYSRLCSRPSFFLHRTVAVAACGGILLFSYGVTSRYYEADLLGRQIHEMFSWMAMLFVFGLALTESALAIPTERSGGTLTVLLTAPMTPRRLAVGFLLSRVLFAFTALVAVLPLEGMAFLVGGVSLGDFGYAVAAILLAGVFGAGIGFLMGQGAANGRFAIARAFALAFTVVLGIPLFLAMLRQFARRGDLPLLADGGRSLEDFLEAAATWGLVTTPAGTLFRILGAPSSVLPTGGPATLGVAAAAATVWVLLALLLAGRRLREETEVASAVDSTEGPWARLRRLWHGAPGKVHGPDLGLDYRPRVWKRALLWKEARPPRGLLPRWGIRAVYAGIFLFYAWYFLSPSVRREFGGGDAHWAWDMSLVIPIWLLGLFVSLPAASFLPEEREKGSLDLLRAAPFSAGDLVLARTGGIALRAIPLFATLLLFAVLGVLRGQVHPLTLAAALLGAVPVTAFLTVLSFKLGITAGSIRVANRRAGGLLLLLLVGWPFLVGFTADLLLWRDWSICLLALDPLGAMPGPFVLLVSGLDRTDRYGNPDEDALRYAFTAFLGLAIYGVLAWVLWRRLPRMLRTGLQDEGKR